MFTFVIHANTFFSYKELGQSSRAQAPLKNDPPRAPVLKQFFYGDKKICTQTPTHTSPYQKIVSVIWGKMISDKEKLHSRVLMC